MNVLYSDHSILSPTDLDGVIRMKRIFLRRRSQNLFLLSPSETRLSQHSSLLNSVSVKLPCTFFLSWILAVLGGFKWSVLGPKRLAMQAPTSNTKRTYAGSFFQVLVVDIMICDLWSTDCLFRFLELAIIVGVGGVTVWVKVAVAELAHGE